MSKTALSLSQEVQKLKDSLVSLRRDFHRHPELGFKEQRTAGIVAERLQAAGIEVRTGVGRTGVVGVLRGDKPGRVAAWRADMDALPLTEKLNLPFASATPGVMHACGHDGHVAIAITIAEILAKHRKELPGTVVFLFQPAEEVLGGASGMIKEGALENPHVETVLGLHLTTQFPLGWVGVRPGPMFAGADFFDIEVLGKGGHGAFPHLSIDPITAAAHILIGMQELVSREIPAQETAVMTVGQMESGTKHNIIPEVAWLRGTIRTFNADIRNQLVERLSAFATRMASAYRAEARVHMGAENCPAVVNDQRWAHCVHDAAVEEVGAEHVTEGEKIMGSDDMSLFLNERPGCYFFVGLAPKDKPAMPHHHPGFEIDDSGLDVGVRVGLRSLLVALQA
ncbi:MAG TPA: M20 family metallopeptidase [bacterium]|nr:M20 family metallopeptidase [bacterium]